MLRFFETLWKTVTSEVPLIGFRVNGGLIRHLLRDTLVAYASGKALFLDFGFSQYEAYLAGAFVAVVFGAGYEVGRGTRGHKPKLTGSFFNPLGWLMSPIAGFGVFCVVTRTFEPIQFVKLLGIWLLGSTLIYLCNRILERNIFV